MHRTLVIAAAIAFGASLSAQAYKTSPPGYLTRTGNTSNLDYGMYLTLWGGRVQHGDARLKGTACEMLEFCWRSAPKRTYTTSTGQGRSFTNWSMKLGHTDASTTKWSSKFTVNQIGAMSTVYSGAFKLPSFTTGSGKGVWGDMGCVKFSKKFMYNGKNDLLQEYESSGGGSLANGYTSTSAYYTDSCFSTANSTVFLLNPTSTTAGPGSKYLPATPFNKMGKNCVDSSQTTTYYDAYSYFSATLYRDNYSLTSLRCKYRVFSSIGRYMAPSAKYIGVLTAGGSDAGIALPGGKCQKLHANLGFPLFWNFGTTFTTGHTPSNPIGSTATVAYNKADIGVCLYWQHAWEDSKTKQLALTVASKVCIPNKNLKDTCETGYSYVSRYKSFKTDTTFTPTNTDSSFGRRGASTASNSLNPLKRIRTK